jgi:hypothetical protein
VQECDADLQLRSAAKLVYQTWEDRIDIKYVNILRIFTDMVSDYDTYTWKEKGNQVAKDMHDFMCLIGREEFRERMMYNINNSVDNYMYSPFSSEEKFVIEINKKKIKNYIERKMKQLEFMKIKLLDERVVNVAITIIDEKEYCSELGNYICETIPEKADICMMICPAAQDVSMRCARNDINLGEDIAKHLGGGGHKKAAGFRISGVKDTLITNTIETVRCALETHTTSKSIAQFGYLVRMLTESGYVVDVEERFKTDKDGNLTDELFYKYAKVSSNDMAGAFCSHHESQLSGSSYHCLNGKIAMDNERLFDKYSDCPLILPIPRNNNEMYFLLDKIKFFKTREGIDISDNYKYELYVTEYDS